jgi:four helix bundle protein
MWQNGENSNEVKAMSNERKATSKKVERFEELVAWQKAKELAKQVYAVTNSGRFSKDFGLSSQLQRASVSVMSNIAEGFERGSVAEFHRFIIIAKASCAEVRSQLHIAYEIQYLDNSRFDQLMQQAEETSRILGGLKASLARKL